MDVVEITLIVFIAVNSILGGMSLFINRRS